MEKRTAAEAFNCGRDNVTRSINYLTKIGLAQGRNDAEKEEKAKFSEAFTLRLSAFARYASAPVALLRSSGGS